LKNYFSDLEWGELALLPSLPVNDPDSTPSEIISLNLWCLKVEWFKKRYKDNY